MAGLFDIFTNQNAQNAADAQRGYLQAGYGQLSDLFGQGRGAATSYTGQGIGSLADLSGQGRTAATGATGQANQSLADLFGAGRGTMAGVTQAGLQPLWQTFNTGAAGTNAYANATGVNGQAGNDAARANFQTSPGYQFQLDQGNQNILRNQAATGQLNSGGTNIDLLNYGQGVANQDWGNYVNRLSPFLSMGASAAGGLGQAYGNLGANLGQMFGQQGQLTSSNTQNLGSNLLQSFGSQGSQTAGLNANLGGQLLGNFTNQGNAAFGTQAGIGNAQANADLANNQASQNMWNAIGTGVNLLAGGMGSGMGGNLFGMFGGAPGAGAGK